MDNKDYSPEQLVAHRGLAADYPENTLASVSAAIAAGARQVEFDLQFSRDLVPMLYHDIDLQRVSNRAENISQLDSQQLQQIPAHEPQRFGQQFIEERITPLSGVTTLIKDNPQVHVYVELKKHSLQQFGSEQCLEQTYTDLQPLLEQCTLISSHRKTLTLAKSSFKFPRVGLVCKDWVTRNQQIDQTQADIVFFNLERIPSTATISADCPIAVYEIADPTIARQTLARGADKIESYAVDKLLAALCKHTI